MKTTNLPDQPVSDYHLLARLFFRLLPYQILLIVINAVNGIVGLLFDSDSQENINTARQLLQNAGADYPSITCPSNFDDLFDLQGFPTSYFIDSQGRILGSPVVGAQVDKYEVALQELLNGGEESDASAYAQPSFLGNAGALNLSGKEAPASIDGTP